uniref:Putative lachesin n=1 Tax=Lutzomyia longipalpis TaxID=7200 RepID=A0A1B0CHW0_LUTLO
MRAAPPEITVEKSWVHASEGYDIELCCTVHGDTNSEMLWFQNSFLLDATDRRTMHSVGEQYILSIRNFQSSDFGNYSCVADNSLGRTKKYIEVSGRPGPATFLSPAYSGHLEFYNLTWNIESIPPLEEMNDTYQHPGKWHDVVLVPTLTRSEPNHFVMSHTIKGLERNSVYEAIIQAKNRYGWNEQVKRKLDDVARRLESLYDLLREYKLAPNTLAALNQLVQFVQISDIHQFYTRNSEAPMDDMDFIMSSMSSAVGIDWGGIVAHFLPMLPLQLWIITS